MIRRGLRLAALAASLLMARPAAAYDPDQAFGKGTVLVAVEAGGGQQTNLEGHGFVTDLTLWYTGLRASLLPFEPFGRGTALHSALEIGLEALYQRYESPVTASFGGLGAVFRYHMLALGRLVPYVEVAGFAGGTDLRVREIDSTFTFLLFGGVGASFYVTDRTALYAGYRMIHVSNGNTSSPNRGFEANTGVAGVSFAFH